MNEQIGKRIRLARVDKELSQENMADELGLSIAAYSNIERGKTEITINRLEEIARILGKDVFFFLSNSGAVSAVAAEPGTGYGKPDQLNQKFKKLESLVENHSKEIAALKQKIAALSTKKKGSSKK